ncbi:MAG: hypothetical protein LBH98_01905 [Chitinispirillales bacterium]|jgi:hypothetical protein|nr:hypothetical protein [Chitinispirillales bacterium]
MKKRNISAVYDNDLPRLIEKLGLKRTMESGNLKCKFTGTTIVFENIYSIFPESGDVKLVCNTPKAIKLFTEYVNEHKI